jgi:formate hydrogenlyase subunit 3/multisubunit Na+/H+ antiporter MnhD subunit
MDWLLAAAAIWLAGAALSLLTGRSGRLACLIGPAGATAGALAALVPAISVLVGGESLAFVHPWAVPLGSFAIGLDPLSAVFAVPILVVGMLAAIYGGQYLRAYEGRKNLGLAWFLYTLLLASMLLVVIARNGVLFLLAWEMMSLASFFLVMLEAEKEAVRRAGWTYLVATHLGTAFLLALFALLSQSSDGMDFVAFEVAPGVAGLAFVLAVIGFGTKAGFLALHVWLPEAHPAAPSHVSAVMSGVMIKTGIYGLLRILTFLGPPSAWWGWTLLVIGIASAVAGVLFALSQHHLKRLLAYSSVENIGILAMGLGLGLLGIAYRQPQMAALGLAGSLLHVLNHAVFKGMLFLGAGSVLHATETGEIDRLGGLLKRMPVTGLTFLVGSVAICGLPPLNGFVGELLIYLAAFSGVMGQTGRAVPTAAILVIASLALVGGLAAACFAKAFGATFLGEPREKLHCHGESARAMLFPMLALAVLGVSIGVAGPWLLPLLSPAIGAILPPEMREAVAEQLTQSSVDLRPVGSLAIFVWTLVAAVALARKLLLQGRPVEETGTWDCGYVLPTSRMQYSGSSFVQPIVLFFRLILRPRERLHKPEGYFPTRASLRTETPDVFCEGTYRPLFDRIAAAAARLRWLQQGRIQVYVLYIAIALLVLLIWKLG